MIAVHTSGLSSAPLILRLFGPFEACRGDQPLPRPYSRKELWLLALLVLRADRLTERSWLAGTLWPDSDEAQALYNLRRGLKNLRRMLGEDAFRLTTPSPRALRFDLHGVYCDVTAFDAAITQGDTAALEVAVGLYRGALLEGCGEEWALGERTVREQAYLSALETLARQAHARREFSTAADYLRQVIQADPLRETAQRELMHALAGQGDWAAAVVVYRQFRLHLHQELQTSPDAETVALYQRLRGQAQRSAPQGASAPLVPVSPVPAPCHLPTPLTRLIGREQAIEEVAALLHTSRLLMLTGAGGVGKTQLAIAVAGVVAEDFSEGVWFVNLAPLSDPGLVAQRVATTLQVKEEGGRSLTRTLTDYLATKNLLLALDNCEHLIETCAALAEELLEACPRLHILATSRQPLGLMGERVWRVPSLSMSSMAEEAAAARDKNAVYRLLDYDAPRLFMERAAWNRSGFRLTSAQAVAVAQICRRLDGIPLAIELAARVTALSVEEIAVRLEDRFGLLTRGSCTALPRHQTLRATMEWSYTLLSAPEQRLLNRLSVFVGGWTLEATRQVCGREDSEGRVALDLLSGLIDKSLVIAEPQEGYTRYRLLETVRHYSQEQLAETEEEAIWRGRHRDYFLALAEEAAPELDGPEQEIWFERLEVEHENLRAALAWCQIEKDGAEAGLRLAGALCRFWLWRSYLSEGRKHLMEALEREGARGRTKLRAKALSGAGIIACYQGDLKATDPLYMESLEIYRELGDKKGIAYALNGLGILALTQGEEEKAWALFEESLALMRELGDRQGVAYLCMGLGTVARNREDYGAARTHYEESLSLRRELGNKLGMASALHCLGTVAYHMGEYEAAKPLFEESLAIAMELDDKDITYQLDSLGALAISQGDYERAHSLLKKSLAIKRELGHHPNIPYSLEAFARLAMAQGQLEEAVRLWTAAQAQRNTLGSPLPSQEQREYERNTTAAREAMGKEAFTRAWKEGGAMTFEQAVEYASDFGAAPAET